MNLGPWEIAIILLIILLLFGAKKLPDLARSVGRSARIFKSEVKEMKNEDAPQVQPQPQPDFWDRPENQPRQIAQDPQQPPAQNYLPNQQQTQQ
ncbi:Sec-independent protein translocase subunit TatA [Corynebacterium uterequi]|uniref:Sec-independent protein translocase protein TatA n=1 Tax=Corynebacterium uterequi TaxID=1072256 RepID=A0A0G3HEA0_9CORY|nr:Sec-independent protein translocase subunit TatA [Corynebacterium uterequi]AKK11080.1 twin arginine-targeting protein translocase, TatA/E family [Corynebacterium uterequi]